MAEQDETREVETATVCGRLIGVYRPSSGQLESLNRIGRTIRRGADDAASEFWGKQIDRLGILLEALIVEGDRETVDMLFLQGKLDHAGLLRSVFEALEPKDEAPAKPAKAAKASVRRK